MGDAVIISPPFALDDDDVIAFARVWAANSVQFRIQNCNQNLVGSGSHYAAETWKVTVIK